MKGAAVLGSAAPFTGAIGASAARAAAGLPADLIPEPGLDSVNYFDLSTMTASSFESASHLQSMRPAQNHYQVQGFAIDSATANCYVAQAPDPDHPQLTMSLNGNVWATDPYDQHASGDLVFSRFNMFSGKLTGSMYLMGAGHGGQIAVESAGGRAYLWSEVYPGNPKSASRQVFGTRIARLPFLPGRLMTNTESVRSSSPHGPYTVTRHVPVPSSHEYNATIDTSSAANTGGGLMVVRYRLKADTAGTPRRFTAFDLNAARNGDFSTPLATTTEPTEIAGTAGSTEGFAVCGRYIYLVGNDVTGASYLFQIDFNGTPGSYLAKVRLPSDGEPESVALFAPNGIPERLYYLAAIRAKPRSFNLYSLAATSAPF